MDLIFNAESLRPPITGVGNYSLNLLREFVYSDLVDEVHSFNGTGWQSGEAQVELSVSQTAFEHAAQTPLSQLVQNLRTFVSSIPGTQAVYDAIMQKRFADYAESVSDAVYHETNFILKPHKGPSTVFVHDLSHVHHPEFHKQEIVDYLNRYLPESIERADHVITCSDVVRDEIMEHFGVRASDITTVYHGVDVRYRERSEDECADVLSRYQIGYKKYILMVATLEPRKGIDVLLRAWELIPRDMRIEYPLVLAGSSGWRNSAIREQMEGFIAEGSLKHLGYVPADDLPALLSGATLFTYPSVYEGFGMPVLDAMNSSVPVICRAGTSMAEFSQGSCMLCESADPEELAGKMTQLVSSRDEQLLWGSRGLAQAQKFSWRRCAEETAEIFRRVL